MPKIINTSRIFASQEISEEFLKGLDKGDWAWIFIKEPLDGVKTPSDTEFVFGEYILSLPRLEVKFWDITEPRKFHLLRNEEFAEYSMEVITDEEARQIYDFLKENSDKNIVVSCYAGISRSSAVAQFAAKYMGFDWPEEYLRRTYPNSLVYSKLQEIFAKNP